MSAVKNLRMYRDSNTSAKKQISKYEEKDFKSPPAKSSKSQASTNYTLTSKTKTKLKSKYD